MKKSLVLIVTVTVICMAIWVFFYLAGMPLDGHDTTFVAAVCLLVVAGLRAIWVQIRKKKAGKPGAASSLIVVALTSGCLVPAARAQTAPPGTAANQGFGDLACTPSTPVAKIGETIGLNAWALPGPNENSEYKWLVDAGDIDGAGREVRWRLAGARPGIHLARVQRARVGYIVQECALQLMVVAGDIDLRGGHRASGRAWLLPDMTEDTRYGLRSYVLFSTPPANDEQRERYLRLIQEYLKFPSSEVLEKYYESAKLPLDALNVTYLPLKSAPSPQKMGNFESDNSDRMAAEDLLRRYDYERAVVILGGIEGEHHNGPYLVSYPESRNPIDQPYIFQDLSWVPAQLIPLWVREFLNLAAQERDWSKPKTASFVLKVRTMITVGGSGYDVVKNSVKNLVTYDQGGTT